MIRADSSAIQCRVLHSLNIISHRFRFVKGFFKSFLKTFSTTFQPERKCPSIISHPLAFVKRFFKSFFNFFRDSFRGRLSRSPARWQLAYYSTFVFICQQVFAKFFRFGEGGSSIQKKGTAFVHHAQILVIQSFKPAQKPFRPDVFPWGSKQWKATTRLRFRSAQTPCPYMPPPAITPSVMRQMP